MTKQGMTMESIILPDSVTNIKARDDKVNINLTFVTIPNYVSEIGDEVLSGYFNLLSVCILNTGLS